MLYADRRGSAVSCRSCKMGHAVTRSVIGVSWPASQRYLLAESSRNPINADPLSLKTNDVPAIDGALRWRSETSRTTRQSARDVSRRLLRACGVRSRSEGEKRFAEAIVRMREKRKCTEVRRSNLTKPGRIFALLTLALAPEHGLVFDNNLWLCRIDDL